MNKISIFIKYVLSVIVCLFMMTGCVEEFEADLPEDDDTKLLVVDGTICSNQHNQFHLTWSSMVKNEIGHNGNVSFERPYEKPLPVNGAKVTICGTDGSVYECKEDVQTERTPKEGYYDPYSELYVYYDDEYGNFHFSEVEEYNEFRYSTGIYSCDVPELKPDVSYYLTIKYWDDVYQSTPEKPIRTPDIESLEYFQKDSLSDVEVLLTTAAPDDPSKTTFFIWDYSETWELRPSRTTRMYLDVSDNIYDFHDRLFTEYYKLLYPKYGWKTVNSNSILIESTAHYAGGKLNKYQIVSIPRDDERISWNYSHKLNLRAISKDEYEYAMESRQAGWEMGGLFTPQPSVLPTNIRCLTSSKKVLGYVGCAQNVISKRIYIDGTKVSRVLPESPVKVVYRCNEPKSFEMLWDGWLLYSYNEKEYVAGEQVAETHWVHAGDLDVRRRGATTVKPDYMPPFGEDYKFVDPGFNIDINQKHNSYYLDYESYEE